MSCQEPLVQKSAGWLLRVCERFGGECAGVVGEFEEINQSFCSSQN